MSTEDSRKEHCAVDRLADSKIGRLVGYELIRHTPKIEFLLIIHKVTSPIFHVNYPSPG
jgi:hypothetical protein